MPVLCLLVLCRHFSGCTKDNDKTSIILAVDSNPVPVKSQTVKGSDTYVETQVMLLMLLDLVFSDMNWNCDVGEFFYCRYLSIIYIYI
jgi:hypothetical protein